MIVGKIYVGLIIVENWRVYKLSQFKMNNFKMVSFKVYCIFVQVKKMFCWKNCLLLLMLKIVKKLMVVFC